MHRPASLLPILAMAVAACDAPEPLPPPGPGPSPTPLVLDSVRPADGSTDVPLTTEFRLFFDRALDPASVSVTTVPTTQGGTAVPQRVLHVQANRSVRVLAPTLPGLSYVVTATTQLRGALGERLAANVATTITAAAQRSGVVDGAGRTGQGLALTVDTLGVAHAAYVDSTNAAIRYARCASACGVAANWQSVQVVQRVQLRPVGVSLAVSRAGTVAIAYVDPASQELHVAICTTNCLGANPFTDLRLDSPRTGAGVPSITVDRTGRFSVAWFDPLQRLPRLATCLTGCVLPGQWNADFIDIVNFEAGRRMALRADTTTRLHVVYDDSVGNTLRYATCLTGCTSSLSWTGTDLGASRLGGITSVALGIDPSQRPIVSAVRGRVSPSLVVARCTAACTAAIGWNDVVVETTDAAGGTGVEVDVNDRLHVAYVAIDSTVRYATCVASCETATRWVETTLASSTRRGQPLGLSLARDGTLRFAYWQRSDGDLVALE